MSLMYKYEIKATHNHMFEIHVNGSKLPVIPVAFVGDHLKTIAWWNNVDLDGAESESHMLAILSEAGIDIDCGDY